MESMLAALGLGRGLSDDGKPLSPEERLAEALKRHLPWVTEVSAATSSPGLLDVKVTHTYPEGIDITPWVERFMNERVAVGVKCKLWLERVDP